MNGLGAAQAALEVAIQDAKNRRQFGKPIGAFQLIQGMITDMLAEVDAACFLVPGLFRLLAANEGESEMWHWGNPLPPE
jgi:acyl-CoA dehydrogenase